jgi:hypothetical protein
MIISDRHQTVRMLAIIIGIEAAVVMAGWVFGIDWMTRITPEGFSIHQKFTTAFLFLCSSLGLHLVSRVVRDEDELAMTLFPGIMLTIIIITVSMLMGRLLGIPTGIETLFAQTQDPIALPGFLSTAGLPSLVTLIDFTLFTLVCAGTVFFFKVRQIFLPLVGLFISLTGLIAILGYIFHVPVLYYDIGSTIPMAFNTALCFILLGVGMALVSRINKTV